MMVIEKKKGKIHERKKKQRIEQKKKEEKRDWMKEYNEWRKKKE